MRQRWGRSDRTVCARRVSGRRFVGVLLDLTVPGCMGGKEAAAEIRRIDPSAKLIFSSGYADAPILSEFQTVRVCRRDPQAVHTSRTERRANAGYRNRYERGRYQTEFFGRGEVPVERYRLTAPLPRRVGQGCGKNSSQQPSSG